MVLPKAKPVGRARLKRAGGSLVVTVPATARNLLDLTEGQEVAISVEGSRVILDPITAPRPQARQPRYTLDELVTGMEPEDPGTAEDRDWTQAPPAGREIW